MPIPRFNNENVGFKYIIPKGFNWIYSFDEPVLLLRLRFFPVFVAVLEILSLS